MKTPRHYTVVNVPWVFCRECSKRGVRAIDRTREKKVLVGRELISVMESASLTEFGVSAIGSLSEVMSSVIEALHVVGWTSITIDTLEWCRFVQNKQIFLIATAFSKDKTLLCDADIVFVFHSHDGFLLITISERP